MTKKRQCRAGFERAAMTISGAQNDLKRIGLCRGFAYFRAEVEKRARKVLINNSVEQLLTHLFKKS